MNLLQRFFLRLCILFPSAIAWGSQDFPIYDLWYLDDQEKGFVSISDSYWLSQHEDSLAIPETKYMHIDSAEYLQLSTPYRERFFKRTRISEEDQLFIYDYSKGIFVALDVRELNVVALLSTYTSKRDWPYSQEDYRIGFEIDTVQLEGMNRYYPYSLVAVGRENPFSLKGLQKVVWKKIDATQVPTGLQSRQTVHQIENQGFLNTNCWTYETAAYIYYLEDFQKEKWGEAKRLMVVEKGTGEKIHEGTFFTSEGTSFAPMDNQWTGQLFKNQPPVIFGFQWDSFDCPGISFLSLENKVIRINCDNRH